MNLEKILNFGRKIIPKPLFSLGQPVYHLLLAMTGNLKYGFPGRKMIIIGVTGTNGKSTTCELINSVLKASGLKTGMLTTVAFEIAGTREENMTSRTTLGRWQLQKKLAEMVETGCTHAVLEVASEGIAWHRIWGIPFDVAVFTNLAPEHLNFHKNMENYRNVKKKLFQNIAKSLHKDCPKTIIINADDKEWQHFFNCEAEQKITYGINNGQLWATNMYFEPETSFEIADGDTRLGVHSKLPAKFNIYNMLAAYSVGKALGLNQKKIVKGIQAVELVEGRMHRIPNDLGLQIFIDYAVTPDSFELLFRELRRITKNRVIAVFGATGDRDKTKRPELGRVAAKLADYIILTDEESYSEKPEEIIEEIAKGVRTVKKHGFEVIVDRREAIKKAIMMSFPNDTIVITGMGHQRYRNVGGNKKVIWHEPTVVNEVLEEVSQVK